MTTRVKYDGLPEGAHTFTYEEKPGPDGKPMFAGIRDRIVKGDVIELEDLNDPDSERARICRLHVTAGLAKVIDGETPKRKAAEKI